VNTSFKQCYCLFLVWAHFNDNSASQRDFQIEDNVWKFLKKLMGDLDQIFNKVPFKKNRNKRNEKNLHLESNRNQIDLLGFGWIRKNYRRRCWTEFCLWQRSSLFVFSLQQILPSQKWSGIAFLFLFNLFFFFFFFFFSFSFKFLFFLCHIAFLF